MSTQTEALTMAGMLDQMTVCEFGARAAAELRRLHAVNVELMAFAKSLVDAWEGEGLPYPAQIAGKAIEVIAKAEAA